MEKNVTLKLLHYEIRGMALIIDWYDSKGSVEMRPTIIDNIEDDVVDNFEILKTAINDGGFGAKEILGGKLNIFAVYGPTNFKKGVGYTPFKVKVAVKYINPNNEFKFDVHYKHFLDSTDSTDNFHSNPFYYQEY